MKTFLEWKSLGKMCITCEVILENYSDQIKQGGLLPAVVSNINLGSHLNL